MIDRNSNTSRLIDKLTEKGLVQRESCPNDRRRVDIVLTPEGLHMTDTSEEHHGRRNVIVGGGLAKRTSRGRQTSSTVER